MRFLAGLLTCPFFKPPSRPCGQWHWVLFEDFSGAYSSGSVQDLHLIPFSSLSRSCGIATPKSAANVKLFFQYVKLFRFFLLAIFTSRIYRNMHLQACGCALRDGGAAGYSPSIITSSSPVSYLLFTLASLFTLGSSI